MPVHDFCSERLYIDAPMSKAARITCSRVQHNYLCNVLRLKAGDEILVFNGSDGEWRARLTLASKRACEISLEERTREQSEGPQIEYLFAPLKRARLDYMVQKAVEMGVTRLRPVMTQHTIVKRVNLDRMSANAIEAAEQCAILAIPQIDEPTSLKTAIASWPASQPLVLADEDAPITNPVDVLSALQPGPVGVLVGPEGGFSTSEREDLIKRPYITRVSLGPRIMRADTAAVAILTLVNACMGDWS